MQALRKHHWTQGQLREHDVKQNFVVHNVNIPQHSNNKTATLTDASIDSEGPEYFDLHICIVLLLSKSSNLHVVLPL